MTTTVKIFAHCTSTTEVMVTIASEYDRSVEEFKLQNNESAERYVYGDRNICIREVSKLNETKQATLDSI